MEELTKEYLLEKLLAWYADPANWALPRTNKGAGPPAVRDKGAAARTALKGGSLGSLLRGTCDAYGLHLAELGRRADLQSHLVGSMAGGRYVPDEDESVRIRAALEAMTDGR